MMKKREWLKHLGFTTSAAIATSKNKTMGNKLTIKEALEQGYVYFGKDKGEFQHLHSIEVITDEDFEFGPIMLAEKESYYTPTMSSESIAELLADHIASWSGDETGDDTDDVYDIVKALDFKDAAKKINDALASKKYYKMTNIELIPNPSPNERRL